MSKSKKLKVMDASDQKLGRATIMDRALAQRHGTAYVHAAAFAIDVDRLRERYLEDASWPFAWEVLLTEAYLARVLATPEHVGLLEDMTLHVLDLPRPKGDTQPPLGSQLPFAVYAAVNHGVLAPQLGTCFRAWKRPPTSLLEELESLRKDAALAKRLATRCLDTELDPPLVAPVRDALLTLSEADS